MKFVHPNVLSSNIRDLLEVWKSGELTDVIVTKTQIGAYMRGEMVSMESFTEEEMIALIEQTVPVKIEKEWGMRVSEGQIVKYSFGISNCCIVRAILWADGMVLRFIPLRPEEVVGDISLPQGEPFFHVVEGGTCSGKTTKILALLRKFCRKKEGAVVFCYEDPQEMYVEEDVMLVHVPKSTVEPEDFADLAVSSVASLCIVQHATGREIDIMRGVHRNGMNVILEVRKGEQSNERGV